MTKKLIHASLLKIYHPLFYVTLAFVFLRGKVLKWDFGLFEISLSTAKLGLVLLFSVGAFILLFSGKNQKVLVWPKPLLFLSGIALFISVRFSQNPLDSVYTLGVICCYIAFFYAVSATLQTKNQIAKVLLLWSVISIIVCLANIFYFAWVVEHSTVVPILEKFPFWPGKNMLGLFLVLNISMALGLLVGAKNLTQKVKVWIWGVLLLNMACLVITFSRGAWVSMGMVFLFLAFFRPKIFIPILLIGMIGFTLFAPFGLKGRVFSIANLKEENVQERLYIWQSAIEMVKDYPLNGVGLGGFYKEYLSHYKMSGIRLLWAGEHAHNLYLHVLAETGLLGLLALLFLIGFLLLKGWLHFSLQKDQLLKGVQLGALLAWIGFLFYSVTDSTFNGNFSPASMFHVNLCLIVITAFLLFKPKAEGSKVNDFKTD